MERATEVVAAGRWPAAEQRDRVVLAYDERHRRRRRFRGEGGLEVLLDLPQAAVLHEGDGLKLAGGGYVAVAAAPEPLLEITAANHAALARLAWHLGNRHLPVSIGEGRILIRADKVIADMLAGLGARLRPVREPFEPEGGAYDHH